MNRRDLMAGIGAATLLPRVTWADAHDPAFLSAARYRDGTYHLCGLGADGSVLFHLPIPDRGHAAAAHPDRPEAVAFARRPGQFASVIDCARGTELARLTPPPDRHFYGHGVFSQDGSVLFTTENDLDTLQGRIGVWHADHGYARVGDFASGGKGPHDIARLPGTDTFVIANGGIETHPDTGRTPLNLATMRSNLAYVDTEGAQLDIVQLDQALRQNSIRHLSVRRDGLVAAGMQWNGPDHEHPPLVMTHTRGTTPHVMTAPPDQQRHMQGYVGSIAFLVGGGLVGVTSPRGGMLHVFDAETLALETHHSVEDVCGLATTRSGMSMVTSGTGISGELSNSGISQITATAWQWDNHLVPVG